MLASLLGMIYPQPDSSFPPHRHFSVFLRFAMLRGMTYQLTQRRARRARFPNAIREYRVKAGLSQRGLSEQIGRSRSVISAWERGHYLPTLPFVFRLAISLDTLVERLYWDLYRPTKESDRTTKKHS
jgi:putative transcriptional regulator